MITRGSGRKPQALTRFEQALLFLRVLTAGLSHRLWLELRTFARRPHRVRQRWDRIDQLEASARWCIAEADRGHDVYAAVQPRRTRQGSATAVGAIVALYTDLDCGAGKRLASKGDAIARLRSLALLGLAPALLIDSGHGFHAYWPLREALDVDDQGAWKNTMRAIASSLDGDPTVTDLPRILRVPGTLNWKQEHEPKPVQLVHVDDRRFNLLDFDELPPALSVVATPRRVEVPVTIAGSRVVAAIRAAGWRVREKRDSAGKLVALVLDEPCPFCPGRPSQATAPRRGTAHVAPLTGAFRCKRALCTAGVEATGQTSNGEAHGLELEQWARRYGVVPEPRIPRHAAFTRRTLPQPARMPALGKLPR